MPGLIAPFQLEFWQPGRSPPLKFLFESLSCGSAPQPCFSLNSQIGCSCLLPSNSAIDFGFGGRYKIGSTPLKTK